MEFPSRRPVAVSSPSVRGLRPVAGVLAGPVAPGTWRLTAALAVSLLTGAFFCCAVVAALFVAAALSWVVAVGTVLLAAALRLGARVLATAGSDAKRALVLVKLVDDFIVTADLRCPLGITR